MRVMLDVVSGILAVASIAFHRRHHHRPGQVQLVGALVCNVQCHNHANDRDAQAHPHKRELLLGLCRRHRQACGHGHHRKLHQGHG
ncbi:hypothetical protein, conserved [Leishmania tarentolae]|uniref:Uncharacterized protein n=1 Tax=Leishmania tarentolae TaxID=5689 RepID=A0A640KP14_LEITA|nr:hypothetical protein, conserved [Leishmania tarentolae]